MEVYAPLPASANVRMALEARPARRPSVEASQEHKVDAA